MKSLLLASILAMASTSMVPLGTSYRGRNREPRNKYGLTPEQSMKMKDMSPKDKKRYLKEIGKVK